MKLGEPSVVDSRRAWSAPPDRPVRTASGRAPERAVPARGTGLAREWTAAGTLAEFLKLARVPEHPGIDPAAPQMIAELLDDHETVIRQLRGDLEKCANKFGDAGTTDFLTGLMEQQEKMAWMLRAIGQGKH